MLAVSVRLIVKTMNRDTNNKTNTRAQQERRYLEKRVGSLESRAYKMPKTVYFGGRIACSLLLTVPGTSPRSSQPKCSSKSA